ncbi:MAG: hypothetical protein V3U75_13550 [Methylococcaceae bacterium]
MYNEIRNKIKFGDVISFSGKGDVSNIIKWKTNSDISHVGMVLESEFVGGEKRIVLVESTSLVNLPDIRTKELIKGVQMQHLSQRLDSYDGQAYYHELERDLSSDQKTKMYDWLLGKHASRTPYDSVQALGSAIDLFDGWGLENKPDFSSLFCSEMVAKAFKIAGLIDCNPSEQTPADVVKYDFLANRVQIK